MRAVLDLQYNEARAGSSPQAKHASRTDGSTLQVPTSAKVCRHQVLLLVDVRDVAAVSLLADDLRSTKISIVANATISYKGGDGLVMSKRPTGRVFTLSTPHSW